MARNSKLGMAFVTFEDINHARTVMEDHDRNFIERCLALNKRAGESKLAMKPHRWNVWFATRPDDIIWENLSNRHWQTLKKFTANLLIFIIAFFLTTPQYLVKQLEPFLENLKLPVMLTDILPSLLLILFSWLLPVIIYYVDFYVGHWTRSGQNHAIMIKTFLYLVLMVIALPTFTFTTTKVFFEYVFRDKGLNWECLFGPEVDAFFVNYVITAALTWTGLELVRFGEISYYLLQVCLSRSKADTPAIRKASRYEFRFGDQYARMMLIFAMVVMFSLSCPLITPFGLLYFILKYMVDKHNLAFVYAPSKVNHKMHATAIKMVIVSVALLQVFTLTFNFVKSQNPFNLTMMDWRTRVCLILLVVTINVCSAQIWSHTCRKIAPIKYQDVMLLQNKNDGHDNIYLPSVLIDNEANTSQPSHSPQQV